VQTEKKLNEEDNPLGSLQMSEITKRDRERMMCAKKSVMPLDFTKQPNLIITSSSLFFTKHLRSKTGAYIIEQVAATRP
jgi:hypothetical protein